MKCFNSQRKKKIIYHTGAWSGNFGDSIIQQSIRKNLIQLAPYDLEFRYINCQQTEFDKKLINEINQVGDLLLIGGGGLVFYRPQDNSKSGWQWNIEIEIIDYIKIPFVVYGIGFNQFEYDKSDFIPITNQHLKTTVQKAKLFSVRNSGSKRDLVFRGCDEKRIEIIPDSGMFLVAQPIVIPKLNYKKIKIGFNWTTDRENQTFPEPYFENKERFINTCLETLNYAIKEKNAQIFYIGHMSKEFDKEIINRLKSGLVEKPVIIDEELENIYPPSGDNAGLLVDVYRQMDVVIGMRGHANIVAFGQNTPFIGMGSHRKIRYFLDDVNRNKYFFDVRPNGKLYNLDLMRSLLDKIIQNNQEERAIMRRELKRQNKIFMRFNKEVINLLK